MEKLLSSGKQRKCTLCLPWDFRWMRLKGSSSLCFQIKVKLDTLVFTLSEREKTGSLSHLTQGSCPVYSELCYESTVYFVEVTTAFMGRGSSHLEVNTVPPVFPYLLQDSSYYSTIWDIHHLQNALEMHSGDLQLSHRSNFFT